MKVIKIAGIVIVAPIALIVLTYFYYRIFHSHTYRYRITVEVETEGKVQSGSGIFETRWQYSPGWLRGGSGRWDVSLDAGEAPVVDLQKYGVLIATHSPTNPYNACIPRARSLFDAPHFAISRTAPGGRPPIYDADKKAMFEALEEFRGRYQLAPYELPQLVWLPDRDDRLSGRIVCPLDLTAAINQSVHLNGVIVEMTTERPNGAIYTKLHWLETQITNEKSDALQRRRNAFELRSYELLGNSPKRVR